MLEAACYARKSVVKDDSDVEGIQVQIDKNRRVSSNWGWNIPDHLIYVDEGISASKGLERPGWLKMLEDIKAGKIKRLIVRDQARLSRDDIEIFIFLKTIQKHNVEVRDSYGREIKNDLGTKVKSLIDADYAAQVGKNVRDKKQHQALQGKPPATAKRPYGYEKNYAALIPEEAKIIQEAARRVIAGESLSSIANDFTKRGIMKYNGKRWAANTLSRVLRRPENAALRSYAPSDGSAERQIVAKGIWPAIYDEQTYYQLTEALSGKVPFAREYTAKYLLSGVMFCALCGNKLRAGRTADKKAKYWCPQSRGGCGKITISMEAVDEYVTALAYQALKRHLKPQQEEVSVVTHEDRIEALEAKLEDSRKAFHADLITLSDFIAVRQDVDMKIKELRHEQSSKPKIIDSAEAFLEASIDRKRAVIQSMFVIAVKQIGKGKRFSPERLIIEAK